MLNLQTVHEKIFQIRLHECDVYRHINNANYMRYILEVAYDSHVVAGHDHHHYQAMRRKWVLHSCEIEYLCPIKYGDSVRLKSWVVDFRGSHSRRMYEIYSVNEGELAARASTDWVLIDLDSNRPTAVPPEIVADFLPSHVSREAPPETPPPASPVPACAFKMRRRVTWHDIDPSGHVHQSMYLCYLDDCGMKLAATFGWTLTRMWEAGFGIIVQRHEIEFLRDAVMDDELEIATWLSSVKRVTADRIYTITRVKDNVLLARVRTLYVWVDPKTGGVKRMPKDFSDDFDHNLVKLEHTQS